MIIFAVLTPYSHVMFAIYWNYTYPPWLPKTKLSKLGQNPKNTEAGSSPFTTIFPGFWLLVLGKLLLQWRAQQIATAATGMSCWYFVAIGSNYL